MNTENLSTLKIHKLTQAQYDRELTAGNIDENALYLTPDEEIDLDSIDKVFIATYGTTTYAEVSEAHAAGKLVFAINPDGIVFRLVSINGAVARFDGSVGSMARYVHVPNLATAFWNYTEEPCVVGPDNANDGDILVYNSYYGFWENKTVNDLGLAPTIQCGTEEVTDGATSSYPEGTLYVVIE